MDVIENDGVKITFDDPRDKVDYPVTEEHLIRLKKMVDRFKLNLDWTVWASHRGYIFISKRQRQLQADPRLTSDDIMFIHNELDIRWIEHGRDKIKIALPFDFEGK